MGEKFDNGAPKRAGRDGVTHRGEWEALTKPNQKLPDVSGLCGLCDHFSVHNEEKGFCKNPKGLFNQYIRRGSTATQNAKSLLKTDPGDCHA